MAVEQMPKREGRKRKGEVEEGEARPGTVTEGKGAGHAAVPRSHDVVRIGGSGGGEEKRRGRGGAPSFFSPKARDEIG